LSYGISPILFIVFNRPDTTKKVFEAIRQARPSKLFVAADGHRLDKIGEESIVREVRTIATNVDWECEVFTLFQERNLGCKMAVSRAISWFFDREEEGIILEDDCLPDQTFFRYCEELLELYRHDSRIMAISGDNFQPSRNSNRYSYYFSRYNHVWGWASWRRAWSLLDLDLATWPEVKANGLLEHVAGSDLNFIRFWSEMFDKCHAGKIDTWDFPWMYSCWIQSGLTILPSVNLVSNIGFGANATHTIDFVESQANLKTENMVFPLKHPRWVVRDVKADRFMDRDVLRIGSDSSKEKSLYNTLKCILKKLAK
jgi:hypothetical protein